jgi:uncharacterized protein (TIGR03086 family)
MDAVELLRGVLTKTGDLVSGVTEDQWDLETPCPDYDVRALLNHLIGWIQVFDAGCHDRTFDGDPSSYQFGSEPAAEFRTAADSLVAGWESLGFDRQVRIMSGEMPSEMAFNITVMEYLTHGWDLAIATSQRVPFTEQEADETLARARRTLPPETRGDGSAFGEVVPVSEAAPAVDRLVAFLGRRP